MKLLLFSDSHNNQQRLRELAKRVREEAPDAILFAGDGLHDASLLDAQCPVYAVRGNCDLGFGLPEELALPLSGQIVYLSHGHLHRAKRTSDLLAAAAKTQGARVAVYGHTHQQAMEWVHGVYCVNPGALANGDYAWLTLKDGAVDVKFKNLSDKTR